MHRVKMTSFCWENGKKNLHKYSNSIKNNSCIFYISFRLQMTNQDVKRSRHVQRWAPPSVLPAPDSAPPAIALFDSGLRTTVVRYTKLVIGFATAAMGKHGSPLSFLIFIASELVRGRGIQSLPEAGDLWWKAGWSGLPAVASSRGLV